MDSRAIEYIKNMDTANFYNKCSSRRGECEACGSLPVTALLYYAKKHNACPVFLKYLNSGDTGSDKRSVVGYAAFCFVKGNEN